jgi:hypothetical protein
MGMKPILCLVLFAVLVSQQASATMPRNPERLLRVKTCSEAEQNLLEARKGSPLINATKKAKIVCELEKSVKRLCGKKAKSKPANKKCNANLK